MIIHFQGIRPEQFRMLLVFTVIGVVPVLHIRSIHADDQPGLVKSQLIFDPAPHPQCHSSTIVETPSGLVAAWFGGTKEGEPDVGIWLSRQIDGRWNTPVEVANGAETEVPRVHCGNPVLFQIPAGPLLLFYKTGPDWKYVKRSHDHGITWSKPERLPNGFFGPIKNKPVLLDDGSILCPSSTEFSTPSGATWQVHFERSVNGGKTWQRIGPINDGRTIRAIQPSILIHPGKRLQALGRTQESHLFEAWSEDNGQTWGPMTLIDLPNCNSGTDAVTLADGRHILVYNHSSNDPSTGKRKGIRSPLNVAVSKDGKLWEAALVLENEPNNQFSYPAVIQTSDGMVHITYTWKRLRIKHAIIDPTKLTTNPILNGRWP